MPFPDMSILLGLSSKSLLNIDVCLTRHLTRLSNACIQANIIELMIKNRIQPELLASSCVIMSVGQNLQVNLDFWQIRWW